MALAYTAPTWTDGSGEGISASNLQAISNCIQGLVQGSDKAVHSIAMANSTITLTFADGTQETVTATGLKGISSIAKTGTAGNVDTYTITYTDGTTSTFTITNGATGATPVITMTATADATSSSSPTVNVTKTGSDEAPSFALAFSGLKGAQGEQGPTGADGQDGQDGVSPEVTITSITGGHTVEITDADHPSGQSFNVMDGTDGQDGTDGTDGVSPEVTITTIAGGHRVTITDADHPGGQSFDVMDGSGAGDMTAAVYDSNSAVATAGGIAAYVSDELDEWTAEVTASSSGTSVVAQFNGLNKNYGYDLYCKDTLVGIIDILSIGFGDTVDLTYVLDGATAGTTKCKLRILK